MAGHGAFEVRGFRRAMHFGVDSLVVPPGSLADAAARRLHASLAAWPRPAFASLAGTSLAAWLSLVRLFWRWRLLERVLGVSEKQ